LKAVIVQGRRSGREMDAKGARALVERLAAAEREYAVPAAPVSEPTPLPDLPVGESPADAEPFRVGGSERAA
jgi:hypothetical protein